MSANAHHGGDRVMTEFESEPNIAAISTASRTDHYLTKAVVGKPGWPARHDPAASAAAREHGLALNAAALAQLDWLPVEP